MGVYFILYNFKLSLSITANQEKTTLSTLPISSFKTIADKVYKDSQGLSDDSKRAFETDMRYWAGYLETRLKGQERLGHEVILTFIKDHYDGLPKRVDAKLVRMGAQKSWAPRNSPPSTASSPRLGASASSRVIPIPWPTRR